MDVFSLSHSIKADQVANIGGDGHHLNVHQPVPNASAASHPLGNSTNSDTRGSPVAGSASSSRRAVTSAASAKHSSSAHPSRDAAQTQPSTLAILLNLCRETETQCELVENDDEFAAMIPRTKKLKAEVMAYRAEGLRQKPITANELEDMEPNEEVPKEKKEK